MKQFPWEGKCVCLCVCVCMCLRAKEGARERERGIRWKRESLCLCSVHYLLKALSLREMDFPISLAGIGICNCFSDDKVPMSSLNRVCWTLICSPSWDLKILSYHEDGTTLPLMCQITPKKKWLFTASHLDPLTVCHGICFVFVDGSLSHGDMKLPVTWEWKFYSVVVSGKRKCHAPQGSWKVWRNSVWSGNMSLKVYNVLLADLTAMSSDTLTLSPP